MSKYSVKPKKVHVARFATPSKVISDNPITDRYSDMTDAKSVLECRHAELKSWRVLAYELAEPHPTLTGIVKRGRQPNAKLIKKINNTYGCHLHLKTIKADIPVCPICDKPYEPKHHCKTQPTKYAKHPVMRVTAIRRMLKNPYLQS